MYRIILVLLLLVSSSVAHTANTPNFPFVISAGKAEREVKPDIATLSLRITAFDKESEVSLDQVGAATKSLLAVLESYGVGAEDIEATNIEKSTTRKRNPQYNSLEILGYDVSRSLTIEIQDLSKFSELVSDIVAIDNISRVQTSFDISNRNDIEQELVAAAGKDAREKAEQMAASLGAEVQSVFAISQDSNFESFLATSGMMSETYMLKPPVPNIRTYVTMFVPKSITISQGINVVFKIK